MDILAEEGDLCGLINAYNNGEQCTKLVMDSAAKYGHLHIIKWLHENTSVGCSTWAFDYACMYNHFEVAKWLYHNRTEGATCYSMDWACYKGNFKIVKWLFRKKIIVRSRNALSWAILNKNYNIAMYLLRKNICTIQDICIIDYNDLLPCINRRFRNIFNRISKQIMVYRFLLKYMVYRPSSLLRQRFIIRKAFEVY